jgi:hypothetical protein
MNSREAVRRLRAFRADTALPCGERLSLRVADPGDVLIVAFVRMGGESRPWGLAFGHPDAAPTILSVPEGRDRDLVSDMVSRFAPELLSHLRSPAMTNSQPREGQDLAPLRQLWLPNASHLDMLHHLAYAYTFTRAGGEAQGILNALGRTTSWLFRSAWRSGSQQVVIATQALRGAFTFPAEDARQGHLGYLLAWLDKSDDHEGKRRATAAAERLSISTTLDPTVERTALLPIVEAWRAARGDDVKRSSLAERIQTALASELERRFVLTASAWHLLREDPRRENRYLEELVDASLADQWFNWARVEAAFARGEQPYVPSVETDRDPRSAAASFEEGAGAAELVDSTLLHDDQELVAEAIATGDAFVGKIVGVADEGIGRVTLPIWSIEERSGGPLRLREGNSICVVGLPRRTATVREIRSSEGVRHFEVVLSNLKKKIKDGVGQLGIAPNDPSWIGEQVAFAEAGKSFAIAKRKKLWQRDMPGAWLTLSSPAPQLRATPDVDPDGE